MVRRPQNHRIKVLLAVGAQNFQPTVRVPEYLPTGPRDSLPATILARTLHAWRFYKVPTRSWLVRQAILCGHMRNCARTERSAVRAPWVVASSRDLPPHGL